MSIDLGDHQQNGARGVNTLRWIISVIFALLQFWISLQVASPLVKALVFLLYKAGAQDAWFWYTAHPLQRGLLVGLVGGLIPLQAALGLFRRFDSLQLPFLRNLEMESARRWICIIFVPLLLADIVHWWNLQSYASSVFGGNSERTIPKLFQYLSSTIDCRSIIDWSAENQYGCFMRPTLYWLITTSIGFSFAPMILRLGQTIFPRESPRQDLTDPAEGQNESTMEVKTETK